MQPHRPLRKATEDPVQGVVCGRTTVLKAPEYRKEGIILSNEKGESMTWTCES